MTNSVLQLKRQIKHKSMDIRAGAINKAAKKFRKKFRLTCVCCILNLVFASNVIVFNISCLRCCWLYNSAVETEFKLQKKANNRIKYLEELEDLRKEQLKARQAKIDADRAKRRDAVIKQMLNAHKHVKKKKVLLPAGYSISMTPNGTDFSKLFLWYRSQ